MKIKIILIISLIASSISLRLKQTS